MAVSTIQILELLQQAKDWKDSNPGRSLVTGYEHALLAATAAERDNAPPEYIVMALIHDLARPIDEEHHGQAIADLVSGRLPTDCVSVLRHHGEFQNSPLVALGNKYYHQPWFGLAVRMAFWDATSFDPSRHWYSYQHFIPHLQSVFKEE